MPKILPRTARATKKPCFLVENRAALEYPLGESIYATRKLFLHNDLQNRSPHNSPQISPKFAPKLPHSKIAFQRTPNVRCAWDK